MIETGALVLAHWSQAEVSPEGAAAGSLDAVRAVILSCRLFQAVADPGDMA
jgi:hypothetical protein